MMTGQMSLSGLILWLVNSYQSLGAGRDHALGICEISASASNIMVSAHSWRDWATIKLL